MKPENIGNFIRKAKKNLATEKLKQTPWEIANGTITLQDWEWNIFDLKDLLPPWYTFYSSDGFYCFFNEKKISYDSGSVKSPYFLFTLLHEIWHANTVKQLNMVFVREQIINILTLLKTVNTRRYTVEICAERLAWEWTLKKTSELKKKWFEIAPGIKVSQLKLLKDLSLANYASKALQAGVSLKAIVSKLPVRVKNVQQ